MNATREPIGTQTPPTRIDARRAALLIDYQLAPATGFVLMERRRFVWEVHRLNSSLPTTDADPTAIREPDHGIPAGPYAEPVGASEAAGEAEATTHTPQLSIAIPGGSKELLRIALPLILSQSFMTVQVFVDTLLLSWHDPLEMAASFPAVMWYWLFFGVLQVTAGYTSTFVAQYTGANRPHRVGPAVWQGIHFAVVVGILFLAVVPLSPCLIAIGRHPPEIQKLETIYLQCLCFAALPMLVMAAVNGFFSGRGQTWIVLAIEGVGTAVNIALAMLLIFGHGGFPEMGIEGAGWATVAGSYAAALLRAGAHAAQEVPRRIRHARRLEARARALRPPHEVRRPGRDAGVPRRARLQCLHATRRPARRGRARRDHADRATEHDRVLADDGTRAGDLHSRRPAARREPARTSRRRARTPG